MYLKQRVELHCKSEIKVRRYACLFAHKHAQVLKRVCKMKCISADKLFAYKNVYTHTHTHIYTCTHTHIQRYSTYKKMEYLEMKAKYLRLSVCMCVCIYICMWVCVLLIEQWQSSEYTNFQWKTLDFFERSEAAVVVLLNICLSYSWQTSLRSGWHKCCYSY